MAEDEVLFQIETDKVTIDVRAPQSGTLESVLVRPLPPASPIPLISYAGCCAAAVQGSTRKRASHEDF